MITSGLVNQRRARFEDGFRTEARYVNTQDIMRPHVSGFDLPTLKTSDLASPKEDPNVSRKALAQISYQKIFRKDTRPTDRLYLASLVSNISRGGGGKATLPTASPGPSGMNTAPQNLPDARTPPTELDQTLQPQGETPTPSIGLAPIDAPVDTMLEGSADNINDELEAQVVMEVVSGLMANNFQDQPLPAMPEVIQNIPVDLEMRESDSIENSIALDIVLGGTGLGAAQYVAGKFTKKSNLPSTEKRVGMSSAQVTQAINTNGVGPRKKYRTTMKAPNMK